MFFVLDLSPLNWAFGCFDQNANYPKTQFYLFFFGQTSLCRKASVLFLIWDVSLVDGNLMQIPAASSLLVAFLLEVPWVASVVRSRLCNLLERSFWQHYPGFELKTRSLITRNPHRFTVFFLKRHKSVILESATSDGIDLWKRVSVTWNQNREWGWTPIERGFFFIFDDFHL